MVYGHEVESMEFINHEGLNLQCTSEVRGPEIPNCACITALDSIYFTNLLPLPWLFLLYHWQRGAIIIIAQWQVHM